MQPCQWAGEMARYNKWQNEVVFGLCSGMNDAEYMADRGMFFGSLHHTLDHIYMVEKRLLAYCETGSPDGPFEPRKLVHPNFEALNRARAALDRELLDLAEEKSDAWLTAPAPLSKDGFGGGRTLPRMYLMMQLFNHGTHHRAHVTAEFHKMGLDYGCTDIPFNPESLF